MQKVKSKISARPCKARSRGTLSSGIPKANLTFKTRIQVPRRDLTIARKEEGMFSSHFLSWGLCMHSDELCVGFSELYLHLFKETG